MCLVFVRVRWSRAIWTFLNFGAGILLCETRIDLPVDARDLSRRMHRDCRVLRLGGLGEGRHGLVLVRSNSMLTTEMQNRLLG